MSKSGIQFFNRCAWVSATSLLLAGAGVARGRVIDVTSSATLEYVGFSTNTLSGYLGIDPIARSAEILPEDIRSKLGLSFDGQIWFLDPADQAWLWFKGNVDYDAMTLVLSDENGWYDYARESGIANENTMYSTDNYPANSKSLTVHAYIGPLTKAGLSNNKFAEFQAWENPDPKAGGNQPQMKLPLMIESGGYRLTVHRVMSGIKSLVMRGEEKKSLHQKDYKTGALKKAIMPEWAYSGVVLELERRATQGTFAGTMDKVFGDGYTSAQAEGWEEYALVTDSTGTTWSTSFIGSRSGWIEIDYMETPLNLPDNQGPFTFDLYCVKDPRNFNADATLGKLVIPADRESQDLGTTTVKGVKLNIALAGSGAEVPSEFSQGSFEGASVLVSSPDRIPGLKIRVTNDEGDSDDNVDWNFNTSDLMHYVMVTVGSPDKPDAFARGTPIKVELSLPEKLHFQFKAVPERPE